jgi:hypothetical protein
MFENIMSESYLNKDANIQTKSDNEEIEEYTE